MNYFSIRTVGEMVGKARNDFERRSPNAIFDWKIEDPSKQRYYKNSK